MSDVPECSIDRIHDRLDKIMEAIESIRLANATYAGKQERAEQDINGLRDSIAKISVYVERYKSDRNFVLGILACIAAFNGIGYKLATSYLNDLNESIKEIKFDGVRNASEIDRLRSDVLKEKTQPPAERK